MSLLDALGQPRLDVLEEIHAWLGPLGPRDEFVRVVIERASPGEVRYRQAWFAADRVPDHPARWRFESAGAATAHPEERWPEDAGRVVQAAMRAAEQGMSERVIVNPAADLLQYCAAITMALSFPLASRVTWITQGAESDSPAHLLLQADNKASLAPLIAALPRPIERLRSVRPASKPTPSRPVNRPRHTGRMPAILWTTVVLVVGIATGWVMRGKTASRAESEVQTEQRQITTPIPIPEAALTPPKTAELIHRLQSSHDLLACMHRFLAQEGLASPTDARVVSDKKAVLLREDLEFGTVAEKEVSLSKTDVRKLLDVLELLDELARSPVR